jgi:inner membrane protein
MNKALIQKAFAIAALTCVILIALYMVGGVIDDREKYRAAAVQSIEASYAGPQTLVGPVLVRPYTETIVTSEVDAKGVRKTNTSKRELAVTICPRELELRGAMLPKELRHGLYKVEVYELQAALKGRIDVADPPTEGTVVWGEPYLAFAISDARGIAATPKVLVNGVAEPMVQGAPATSGWQPNLRVPLRGMTALKAPLDFAIDLSLDGTETLNIAPVADSNRFYMQSSWRSPLFAGQFLPATRDIDQGGFNAAWNISSLASGTQSQLLANPAKPIDTVSVSLTTLVDPYTLSDRATKYGILFVTLTFGGFFLFELMKQLPIHPVQYLLVGFGLAIFFLLLVSFSEHMAFALAYVIASLACIGLLSFYLAYVLRSAVRGVGFGMTLTTLYSAIYGLLISEDNALVLGSLMLFALLAAVMFITRKVDWYKGADGLLHANMGLAEAPPHP